MVPSQTSELDRPRWLRALGATVAGGLLTAQVGAVVYAHAVQPRHGAATSGCAAQPASCTRYFAWAPNDYLVEYELTVQSATGVLSGPQAAARYHLAGDRWEFPVQQLTDIIEQYERTYGRTDRAGVWLRYRVNGRPAQVWTLHG